MALRAAQIAELADAYRRTMDSGDRALVGRPVEQAILHAVVAESAADLLSWIRTRVQSGHEVGAPLESLAADLAHGNHLGRGLSTAKQKAKSAAMSAVGGAIMTGTWPVWLSAVFAMLLGMFGMSEAAGQLVAETLVPFLLGGGVVLVAIVRALAIAGPKFAEALGRAGDSVSGAIDGIGADAERLFLASMSTPFEKLLGDARPSERGVPVVGELRGWARFVVGVVVVLVGICALFFGAGALQVFESALITRSTSPL